LRSYTHTRIRLPNPSTHGLTKEHGADGVGNKDQGRTEEMVMSHVRSAEMSKEILADLRSENASRCNRMRSQGSGVRVRRRG
jgi:hypothetical protein